MVYIGTFSKTMYPSLRLGYAIVPPAIADAVANARATADRNSPVVEQRALKEFIEQGYFDRHLRRLRTTCSTRHAFMHEALHRYMPDLAVATHMRSGTHLLLTLHPGVAGIIEERANLPAAVAIANAAMDADLVVFPLERYSMLPTPHAQLVLGFGSWEADVIDGAVRKLGEIIRSLAS